MAPNQGATAARVGERQTAAPETDNRWGTDPAAFGAFLRGQREARHRTVQQIAEITKIAAHHFDSLERGDIRRWPGGVYSRGMVRAYARAVGLNAEETVRRFLEAFSEKQDEPSVAPRAVAEPEMPRAAVIRRAASATGIVGVAVAMLLIGWNTVSNIRGAMQSDIASTPQPAPAGENAVVETDRLTSPNDVPPGSGTPAATSGATNETINGAPQLTEGELRVQSDPDGAHVTVNGIGWGPTPVTIKYLPLGVKRVRLTRDGYVSAERRVQISAERPVGALSVTLQPRAD
jgi:cytoskeletal protein RodZ